jgi:hypothetical protein
MLRPKIFQVVPTTDYKVYIYFDDGRIKLYDAKPLIDKGGIFKKLEDISVFVNACTILNNTLAWDITGNRSTTECIDICPDTLYYHCPDVKEIDIPLFKESYDKINNYFHSPGS